MVVQIAMLSPKLGARVLIPALTVEVTMEFSSDRLRAVEQGVMEKTHRLIEESSENGRKGKPIRLATSEW